MSHHGKAPGMHQKQLLPRCPAQSAPNSEPGPTAGALAGAEQFLQAPWLADPMPSARTGPGCCELPVGKQCQALMMPQFIAVLGLCVDCTFNLLLHLT